jgi:hypothetical protein
MNLTTLKHRLWRTRRRRRSTGLAVDSIERRLALSSTLPLQPPHVPSVVAAAVPLNESIHWLGTVNGTFHETDSSSGNLIFSAKGTLSPGGNSLISGWINFEIQPRSGAMTVATKLGKVTADLTTEGTGEPVTYSVKAGTGQYVHTTGEGDAEFVIVERKGKGEPHGTITIHFLTTNEG